MSLLRRRALLLAVVVAAASVLVLVAVADHRRSREEIRRAEVAYWNCAHERTSCGSPDATTLHARWEQRETVYKAAAMALAVVALASFVSVVAVRRAN